MLCTVSITYIIILRYRSDIYIHGGGWCRNDVKTYCMVLCLTVWCVALRNTRACVHVRVLDGGVK